MSELFTPLTLPCGRIVPNRIAKAAMEENMADQPPFPAEESLPGSAGQIPGDRLVNLYGAWADGGAGLLITG
ncbi:MAG: hypothetical protein WBA35_13905, partial [Litorimonas sp.]